MAGVEFADAGTASQLLPPASRLFLLVADYKNGVIGGNLPNFPSFRQGVALGPFLQHHYGIPVYIENDGNLFAYGEALSGALPMVNRELEAMGHNRKYKNLLNKGDYILDFGCGSGRDT